MSWFSEIFETLLSFVPRLFHIPATHGGVLFGRNGKVAEKEAGNRWYWPVIHSVYSYPIVRTTMNLPMQTLTNRLRESFIVGGVIIYEIEDLAWAFAETHDIDDTIRDCAMCSIADVFTTEENWDIKELQKRIVNSARGRLKPFGVKVLKFGITDYAPCTVIRNVTGGEGGLVTLGNEEE